MVYRMLLGYLLAFLKGTSFTSNAVQTSCLAIINMILAVVCIIIGKCFLAFMIFELIKEYYNFSTIISSGITALIFILFGAFSLMFICYIVKKRTTNNIIVDKYETSKRVLTSFLDGITGR